MLNPRLPKILQNGYNHIVRASAERIDLAREVALAKWDSGAAVEDLVREQQVIQAVVKAAPQRGLDESFVANFFRGQIEAIRRFNTYYWRTGIELDKLQSIRQLI